ncbi:MAG: hypothetical protein A3F10_03970 [Coxiella sp. RIFCSPHIGHO2_12_FULL_42_15]|nr:MAG: hypothetical protein A3F10_03970 [Coxiella sp. RIFCSPHIGHO2_12_FULL_42_15]
MKDPWICEFLHDFDNKTHEECCEFVRQLEKRLATALDSRQARNECARGIYKKLRGEMQREKFLKALWAYEIQDNAVDGFPNRKGSCLARFFMDYILLNANLRLRSLKALRKPDDLLTIHIPGCLRNAYHCIQHDKDSNRYRFSLQAEWGCLTSVALLHLGQLEYFVAFLGEFLHYDKKVALGYVKKVKASGDQRMHLAEKMIREQLSGSFDKYQLLASYTRHSFFSRVKYRIFKKEKNLNEVVTTLCERAADHAGASRKVCEEFKIPYRASLIK